MSSIVALHRRYAAAIVAGMLLMLAPLLWGAVQTLNTVGNDVRQWLPSSFRETHEYDQFLETFGSDEVVVISWPGSSADDARLSRFAQLLRDQSASTDGAREGQSWFARVLTGPELLETLTGGDGGVSESLARARLTNVLFGPDGKTTATVAWLGQAGASDRHAAIAKIKALAEQAGVSADSLKLGGPTIESVALDTESERSRIQLAALAAVCASLLGWHCLRNWRLVAIVFATALYCATATLAIVYYSGGRMNILMMSMPTLIYVLGVSAGIHWVNYLRQAQQKHAGLHDAVAQASRAALMPIALTAITTAIGLVSLGISQVVPVRMFGVYSAVGLLVSVPIVFILLPSLASTCLTNRSVAHVARTSRAVRRVPWQQWMVRWRAQILIASLVGMAALGAGLVRLDTSVHLLNLFSRDSEILQDYTWLESHIGPLVPVEVVVEFSDSGEPAMVDRLAMVTQIQQQLNEVEGVSGSLSAATWAPPVPEGNGFRQFAKRRWLSAQLENQQQALEQTGFLRHRDGRQLWRISARVESLSRPDYGLLAGRIHDAVQSVLNAHAVAENDAEQSPIEFTVTGAMPLIYKAQRTLLNDLIVSFCTATALIGVTLMFVLRSFTGGLLALVPNIFPSLIAFGGMGWLGVLCDVGAMMTASVAMGIAVDDTIHLLFRYRRELKSGESHTQCALRSVEHCGVSMWQTSVVCGLSMLVFGLSQFVPTSHFAMLMFAMLAFALFADLVVLPAMLLTRAHRYFARHALAG